MLITQIVDFTSKTQKQPRVQNSNHNLIYKIEDKEKPLPFEIDTGNIINIENLIQHPIYLGSDQETIFKKIIHHPHLAFNSLPYKDHLKETIEQIVQEHEENIILANFFNWRSTNWISKLIIAYKGKNIGDTNKFNSQLKDILDTENNFEPLGKYFIKNNKKNSFIFVGNHYTPKTNWEEVFYISE